MTVSRAQRYSKAAPCPICGGYDQAPRGQGVRCWGFRSDDGAYAQCAREEHAGAAPFNDRTGTYAHRLEGACRCGVTHGGVPPRPAAGPRAVRIVATYDYPDEAGTRLYQKVRLEPKSFYLRRPDPVRPGEWVNGLGERRRVLYRLPAVRAAAASQGTVYLCEGEKDADALAALGLTATTECEGAPSPGQAMKWRPEYTEQLRGVGAVVCLPDADPPGRYRIEQLAPALRRVVPVVKVVTLPGLADHGDVSDWLAAGGTREALEALVAQAAAVPAAPAPRDIAAITADVLAEAEKGPAWRLATGFPSLDAALGGGFREARVGGILAGPGVGKSAILLQIAARAARDGIGTLVVSKEMAEDELGQRYLAQQGKIRALGFLNADLTAEEWRAAVTAQGQARGRPLWIDDRARTFDQVLTLLDTWPYATPVKLLILDYLQLFAVAAKAQDKRAAVEAVSEGLKALAKTRRLVVLEALGVNRSEPLVKGKRVPTIASARESGQIEHDVDYLLLLWEGEAEVGTGCPMIEWRLAKNRVGPKGHGRFRFRPAYVLLEDPLEAPFI